MKRKFTEYYSFMNKACEETISQANNGLYYLEPAFRVILHSEGLDPENVNDYAINWDTVKEYLQLEVSKRNTIEDKKPAVIDWLHKTITTTVEPSMFEEETEFIKNLTEYMNTKNSNI